MRIMASNAADARIRPIKALAVCQSIRLKADGQFTSPMIAHHRFPSPVALPAEVGNVLRRQLSQIRRQRFEVAVQSVAQMAARSRMTMLTCNTGSQRFQRQLPIYKRIAGMASEADFLLRDRDFPSDGIVQILRLQVFIAGRKIEAGNRRIITHCALVAVAVVLQNPGLRACPKIPMESAA